MHLKLFCYILKLQPQSQGSDFQSDLSPRPASHVHVRRGECLCTVLDRNLPEDYAVFAESPLYGLQKHLKHLMDGSRETLWPPNKL